VTQNIEKKNDGNEMKELSRQRKWQLRKRESGQCVTCGRPARIYFSQRTKTLITSLYCDEHEALTKHRKEIYRSIRYEKRVKAGLCPICKEPKCNKSLYCEKHHEEKKIYSRNYYRKRAGIPLDELIYPEGPRSLRIVCRALNMIILKIEIPIDHRHLSVDDIAFNISSELQDKGIAVKWSKEKKEFFSEI